MNTRESSEEEYDDLTHAIDQAVAAIEKAQQKACAQGDHGIHLRFAGFGDEVTYWRCSKCNTTVTTPTFRATI